MSVSLSPSGLNTAQQGKAVRLLFQALAEKSSYAVLLDGSACDSSPLNQVVWIGVTPNTVLNQTPEGLFKNGELAPNQDLFSSLKTYPPARWFGWFSYESAPLMEPALSSSSKPGLPFPLATLIQFQTVIQLHLPSGQLTLLKEEDHPSEGEEAQLNALWKEAIKKANSFSNKDLTWEYEARNPESFITRNQSLV